MLEPAAYAGAVIRAKTAKAVAAAIRRRILSRGIINLLRT
jgi:hypothetical protein